MVGRFSSSRLWVSWADCREDMLRAADISLENGIGIEASPSKHAIAQGFFLSG